MILLNWRKTPSFRSHLVKNHSGYIELISGKTAKQGIKKAHS